MSRLALGEENPEATPPLASTQDVTTPSPASSDPSTTAETAAAPAPTQTAEPEETGPKSLGEAIEAALGTPEAPPAPTDETAGPQADDPNPDPSAAAPDTPDEPDAEIELTDDELNGLGFKARRRIRQLLNQRHTARAEVETLRPDAENYRAVRSFMDTHNLVDQEFAELLHLGADLKSGDPQRLQRFVDAVLPRLQMALEATGRAVSPDLKSAVDMGEMTEDAAREMTRTRRAAELADQRVQELTQREAQRGRTAEATAIQTAVDAWVQQQKTTDPDFGRKEKATLRVVQALVQERGFPKTPAEAVKYAQDALAEVNGMATGFAPAPARPTQPTPGPQTLSMPRNAVAAPPNTLAEAIERALRSA